MKVSASGHLRHRFWGEYSAVIALVFATPADATLALPKLAGFEQSAEEASVVSIVVDSAGVETTKALLAPFGDVSKLDSLERSLDYGEAVELEIEVEDPNQMPLFA